MQVSNDDSSDSGLIPATQIARVQRVDVDVSALILQATAMITTTANECYFLSRAVYTVSTAQTLFPSMLPSVTVTTHCAPVVSFHH